MLTHASTRTWDVSALTGAHVQARGLEEGGGTCSPFSSLLGPDPEADEVEGAAAAVLDLSSTFLVEDRREQRAPGAGAPGVLEPYRPEPLVFGTVTKKEINFLCA